MAKFSIENKEQEILSLYKTHNLSQISKMLKVSWSGLDLYFKRKGLEPKNDRQNLSDYTKDIEQLACDGLNTKQIAEKLKLDASSLFYHIKKTGIIVKNGRFKLDKEKDELIGNLYLSGKSVNQIAAQLKLNSKTVARSLNSSSVDRRSPQETLLANGTRTINSSAFNDFNKDESAAYWYGWLLADGNLSDRWSISMALKGEDCYVLERLKQYVGSSAKVSNTNYFHKMLNRNVSASSFTFANKVLVGRLVEQGMEPRKSCREKLPKFDWLHGLTAPHFWRGLLEGDGSVSLKKGKHPAISLVGSNEILEGFRMYCEVICGAKHGKQLRKRDYGNENFRLIEYSGNDCRKIVRNIWGFKTDNFLLRKKIIADLIIAQPLTNKP